jgi:LuxR family quorum-sensing system transcriptional regulator CciR
MRGAHVIQQFGGAAREARDMTALSAATLAASRTLGFHHVVVQGADGAVWLSDLAGPWPSGEGGDAGLAAASQCYAPFLWTDIPRLVDLTPPQAAFLDLAARTGIGAAVTVPVHRPRGADEAGSYSIFAGCCTFLMDEAVPLPLASLAAAHYVAVQAFDAAEALRNAVTPAPAGPVLTPRQRDCVALAAQGKSDWEIGQLLGISESTVHKHIEDAKRRFGVSTRIQLVVRSLADSKLSFSDVID